MASSGGKEKDGENARLKAKTTLYVFAKAFMYVIV